MAPGKKRSSPSPILIGNCKVEIDADDYSCESTAGSHVISVPKGAKIKISHDDFGKTCYDGQEDNGGKLFSMEDYSYVLVDPKNGDDHTKSLLQDVLNLYMEQLPAMIYAANTGKESHFLEKCISSGKYRTLTLKLNCMEGLGKVIAAVSYQIISTDTRYAEVPLAAVRSTYQNKGIGSLMYNELKERLQNVGISTVLCWADNVSEGFWCKQGFISIGEVNRKGKARRLPIKVDIRRALCFPGGSTLMIAHLNTCNVVSLSSSGHDKPWGNAKSCYVPRKTLRITETRQNGPSVSLSKIESVQDQQFLQDGYSIDSQNAIVDSRNTINCQDNLSAQGVKKSIWETSLSSLKSKRIRSSRNTTDCQSNHLDSVNAKETYGALKNCSSENSGCNPLEDVIHSGPTDHSAEERMQGNLITEMVIGGNPHEIMFMNIADDAKRVCLTKIVEELGGSVTCNGSSCTHVITGKARRTLNFCVALCSGAWIVSPHWLKACFREGKFLDESPFILEDEDYLMKYNFELRDAVTRAKLNPHSLLKGYNVCVAKHIQPSVDVLTSIIKSAGGNILHRLVSVKEPSKAIYLACEEDMEDAMVAAKKGFWTFSSDWFMNCVMKQALDFEAPQFAESL